MNSPDKPTTATKSELAQRLTMDFENLSIGESTRIVNALLSYMKSALVNHRPVMLKGFGTFVPKLVPAHLGRNLAKNEPMQIPDKYTIKFKAHKVLKQSVGRRMKSKPE